MSELPIRLHPPKISGSDWNDLVTYGLILTGDSWPVDYTNGQIFYRTDLNNFYYYNGALWNEIGFVTGSTTNWDNIIAETVEVLDLLTVDEEQIFKDTGNIIVITGSDHWVVPKPGYTPTENYLYLYATMISPADRTTEITDPVLCTNQAFFVEKDTYTHGFLGTASDPYKAMGGGALLMGQGFTGRYCPPLFDLTGTIVDMDDPLGGYASGSSFPAAENYAWFYRTDEETLYQYTSSTWNSMFTNVKSSEYDTLFLIRADTSGPANLYLNNLNVNTIYPQANSWVTIDEKLLLNGNFQIANGWVVSSLNPSGSGLGIGSPTEQWSGSCVQVMFTDDITALNNAWVDINNKLVVHGNFQISDGWVVSSLNPSGSGLGIGSPSEQWSGSCIQGIYTDDISALNNSWVDINDKLVVHGDFQISDGWVVSSLNPSGSVGLGSATEKWTGIVATTGYFDAIEMSGSNMTIKYTGSYIGFRNGETRLYSSSNSVLSIQDVSGNLGTLNVSNIFVDHINSATGNGIYLLDNIRFYDGDSGVKLFDGVNSTGSAGQVLVVNSSGYPVWSGSGGGQWTAGIVSSVTTPLYINSNSLKIYTASTSTSGSLTATDWNTFNNKYGSGSTAILGGITLRNGAYSAGISVNASHVIEIDNLAVQINKAATIGDGTNGLSVSGNTGITGVLNVDKITLSGSYGTAGQVLTSSGSGNRPYWASGAWNGGTVTNDIIISKDDPALRLSESTTTNMVMTAADGISYIESGLTTSSDSKAPIKFTSMLAGTTWMTIETDGQVTIPTTGADAGILIGGDTQIYRSAANVLYTPDTWNIVGHCIITGSESYFALRNGATRMYSDADGVLKVHTSAGALGTLTVSNVFTDHINSASAGGVYMLDSLKLYDGSAGEKLYDATNDSGASGEVLTVNASGLPIWTTGSSWAGGTVTNDIIINNSSPALRFTDDSAYYGWLEYYTGATRTWLVGLGITSDASADYEWYQYSPTSGLRMRLTDDGQLQLPVQSADTGLLIGQDVQLFRSGSNTLCIPDFVNIDPPSGNGKLDIRTRSDDAILNLVSNGDLKATFSYDTSSGSTWLAAFSNSTTYSELHLVGSSIKLENDVEAKGNIAINKSAPALAFQVSSSTKLAMGYDGSNTYFTVSSASGTNNLNFVNNSGSINFTASSGKLYTVSGLQICPNTGGTGQIGNSIEYYSASYVDYVYGKHNGLFGCERSKSGQEWSHEYTTEFDALEYLTHELTKTKFHITYDQKDDKKIICTCGKSVENPCPEHIDEWNDKYTVNTGKITQATGLVVLEQSAKIAKLEMEIVSLKEQIKNTSG